MKKKMKETFEITLRKSLSTPRDAEVMEKVEAAGTAGYFVENAVISATPIGQKYPVCLETDAPENIFAVIEEIKDSKGYVLDLYDIDGIREQGCYGIWLNALENVNGKGPKRIMKGQLQIFAADKEEVSSSELSERIAQAGKVAVENGFLTEEELKEKLEVFQENGIDDLLIVRALEGHRSYSKPPRHPSCIFKDPYLEEKNAKKEEGLIAEGLRAALSRQAVIYEGDKSVGKNVYAETIAWLLGMPLYLITFNNQMSPSYIYGEKTTDNSAARELAGFDSSVLAKVEGVESKRKFLINFFMQQGFTPMDAAQKSDQALSPEDQHILAESARFEMLKARSSSVNIVIDQSELYDWLTDGGMMAFNEMNLADPNFLASFTNQILDGTGFLFIPGRGEVPVHKDCVLVATQNADYQGTAIQNEATMSRFGCITFPQPKSIKKQLVAASEAAIRAGDIPGAKLDSKAYTQCEKFYQQCRSAVMNGDITNACMNIRGFVRALKAVAESNGKARLKRQIQIHVVNTCPTDDRVALNAALENIVTL